jgi:hypothetical protein
LISIFIIDRYPEEAENPKFATYGKDGNTFTGTKDPRRIDYLMHWCDPNELIMSTVEFKLADFKAKKDNGDIISITDHEPLHSEYIIIHPQHCKYYSKFCYFCYLLKS